ncbi:fibronectin type III domain-containing protein [Pedobacter sp.]|nr:fibronectin type III domain-containing protein [Candidatus Saccharibacteria bacterium]
MADYIETFSGPDGAGLHGDQQWVIDSGDGWRTETGFAKRGGSTTAITGTVVARSQAVMETTFQSIEANITTLEYKEATAGASNAEPARIMLLLNFASTGSTYYGFEIDNRLVSRIRLSKIAPVRTDLVENLSYTIPARPTTMRFEMTRNGNGTVTLQGFFDGVSVLTFTDTTSVLAAAPYAGLRSSITRPKGEIAIDSLTYGPISLSVDSTPPSVPVVSFYQKDVDRITVDWQPSTGSPAYYRVFQNGVLVADNLIDSVYTATGLTESTQYTFTMTSVDATGNVSAPSSPLIIYTYANTGFYLIDADGQKRIGRQRQVHP